ncbi:MarR family transcriptional regulator [Roseomonas sp. KE2513]|nr:MarR family transcriptional regulator [Roseomonas sp. KE2513]
MEVCRGRSWACADGGRSACFSLDVEKHQHKLSALTIHRACLAHRENASHADRRRERDPVPRGGRCADGAPDAPPLGAGPAVRAGGRTRRQAGAGDAVRGEAGGLPRQRGTAGRARRVLRAPQGLARLRAQRELRAALPVPRLEVRRGGQRGGHAVRAEGKQLRRPGEAEGLSRARGRRLHLGLHGQARGDARVRAAGLGTHPRRECLRAADRAALQLGADHGRADRQRAFVLAALLGHAAGAGRCRGAGHALGAALDRQEPAHPGAGDELRHALRRDPAADHERGHAGLRADHHLRRALHGADPAQLHLQRGQRDRAAGRHQHLFPLHRLDRGGPREHLGRGVAEVLRDRGGRGRGRRLPPDEAARLQRLPSGSRGDEGRQLLHRDPRHPEPGHRDVGIHGRDRRPHERAAGGERHRGDPVPPDHAGRGRAARGRVRADRAGCAAPAAGQAPLLPGGGAQDRGLADARRLGGGSPLPHGHGGGAGGAGNGPGGGRLSPPLSTAIRAPAAEPPAPAGTRIDPLPFDESVGFLVRDLNRAIQRHLQARLQPHGVAPGAWYFLRVLWEEDGITQRDLARRVGMMEPTAVIALRGIEAGGWIHRVRSETDKRKVHIFLTEAGRDLREVLVPEAHQVNALATRGLSGDEARMLKALLRRARGNFPLQD